MGAGKVVSYRVQTDTICCELSGLMAIEGLLSFPTEFEMSTWADTWAAGITAINVLGSSDSSMAARSTSLRAAPRRDPAVAWERKRLSLVFTLDGCELMAYSPQMI